MVSLADIHKALKKIGPTSAHNKALIAELEKMGHSAEDARVAIESALKNLDFYQNQHDEITLPWRITTGGKTIFAHSKVAASLVFTSYSEWRGVVDAGGEEVHRVQELKEATGHEPSSWSIPVKLISSEGETVRLFEKPLM